MFVPPVHPAAPWRRRLYCGALCLVAGTGSALADDGLAAGAAAALARSHTRSDEAAGSPLTLNAASYPDTGLQPNASTGSIQYLGVTGWLTPRQASSLGLTLGVESGGWNAGSRAQAFGTPLTAYDLGVRWRSRLDQRVQLDVHAWARLPQNQAMRDAQGMIWQQDQPAFGTRLEVQWSSSRAPGWAPEFGAIGLQLEGNSRLLLRARGGGPMLYYRTKF